MKWSTLAHLNTQNLEKPNNLTTPMDSINALKGYGKVGHIEGPPKTHKRNIIITIIAAATLFTLLLCYISTASTGHTTTTTTTKPNYISAVCNYTTYPTACISSLQTSAANDPEQLVKLSLQVSIGHLLNLSSLPVQITDPRLAPAALDCKSLIADSIDGVNASISVMEVEEGEMMLTLMKINDMQTWVSAAMTNLETCVDGLKEMGAGESVWKEMESGVKDCEIYLSNSLGIIAKIGLILDELHIPLH